jgi:hypothetical protein
MRHSFGRGLDHLGRGWRCVGAGNGARCFARFVRLKGLTNKDRIAVSTVSGRIVLQLEDNDQVTVNMGVPEFEPAKVLFRALKAEKLYLLRVAEKPWIYVEDISVLDLLSGKGCNIILMSSRLGVNNPSKSV